MLTCQQLTERVTDFSEGHMAMGERWMLRLHLAMCRNCRTYVKQVGTTTALTGRAPTLRGYANFQSD